MRTINVKRITEVVKHLCIDACINANESLVECLQNAKKHEESSAGKEVLSQLLDNIAIARAEKMPICQDTGFTVVFLEIGQEISFTGGLLKDAINKGVAEGYNEGCLRKSIIKDPLTNPQNTYDNTPAIIHTELVAGSNVKITVFPKGGGAENMSRIKMMTPADGIEGVKKFVIDTVRNAGANPCPPVFIGVGMGGTFDYVAYLAKKALLREAGQRSENQELAKIEKDWLKDVNKLGIGPAGYGGRITALDLFIEVFPRHIASYPVAVNIQCHAHRLKTKTI